MKPYLLVEGSNLAIDHFEKKVAEALEQGYALAGELVTHSISPQEVKFFQTMLIEDDFDDEDEDEDEDEEDEDED